MVAWIDIAIPVIALGAIAILMYKFVVQPFKAGIYYAGKAAWAPVVLGAPLTMEVGGGVYASTGRYGRY